ncbi:tetratricopeptide repeat protein [Candidatus Neomarinimicrobiota bacterium]
MLYRNQATSKFFQNMVSHPQYRIILLFLLAASFTTVHSQEAGKDSHYDGKALSHYMDGDLYMMQGDFAAAAAAFERALSYDSSSATIYLSLGEAVLGQGQLDRARRAGEKARQLEPDDPMAYEFLARTAIAKKEPDRAIEYLDKWAALDPMNLDPLFEKADLLLRHNKYGEAIDTYLTIYDRDRVQQQVLPRAGEIAVSIGDFERAYEAYHRLYGIRPDDVRIARTYAEISVRTERLKEAVEVYEALQSKGQATLANSLQLAWLHLREKNFERAQTLLNPLIDQGNRQWDLLSISRHVAERISDYEQLERISTLLIEVYPDSVHGYTTMAIARNYLDNETGALEILENALQRFPKNPDINYLIGNLYFSQEYFSKAELHLMIALDGSPEASYIQHLLATTWSSMGKYQISDSLYEVVLQADEKDAVVLNNYAYSIAERLNAPKQQLRYARRLSRRSLSIQPENPAFLDTYGWINYRLTKYRTAQKFIAKSLEIRPDHSVVLEHLGEVYLQLGDKIEADKYFKMAQEVRERESPPMVRASEKED